VSEYYASPRATSAPFEPTVVALVAATTKTVLQVATPSTTDIRVFGWGVSFDGVSGTAIPVICQLLQTDTAATVTSLTPELWGHDLAPASLCVGGAALTGFNASAEGTIAVVRAFDAQHVHPQAGYGIIWQDEIHQPRVPVSKFLRIRCKAPAVVNVIPWLLWAEPSL
jgi:hypothetical protein